MERTVKSKVAHYENVSYEEVEYTFTQLRDIFEKDDIIPQLCNLVDEQDQTIAALRSELADLRQWKSDVEESHRQVMDERCPSDEQHCTCVPILRREIAELNDSITGCTNMIQELHDDIDIRDKQLARYREGFGLALKVMGDCEETLRHVLNYVEGQGLSAEQDVKEAIEAIHMFRDAEAVRLLEGERRACMYWEPKC